MLIFSIQSTCLGSVLFSVSRPGSLGSAAHASTLAVECGSRKENALCQIVDTREGQSLTTSLKRSKVISLVKPLCGYQQKNSEQSSKGKIALSWLAECGEHEFTGVVLDTPKAQTTLAERNLNKRILFIESYLRSR